MVWYDEDFYQFVDVIANELTSVFANSRQRDVPKYENNEWRIIYGRYIYIYDVIDIMIIIYIENTHIQSPNISAGDPIKRKNKTDCLGDRKKIKRVPAIIEHPKFVTMVKIFPPDAVIYAG